VSTNKTVVCENLICSFELSTSPFEIQPVFHYHLIMSLSFSSRHTKWLLLATSSRFCHPYFPVIGVFRLTHISTILREKCRLRRTTVY